MALIAFSMCGQGFHIVPKLGAGGEPGVGDPVSLEEIASMTSVESNDPFEVVAAREETLGIPLFLTR